MDTMEINNFWTPIDGISSTLSYLYKIYRLYNKEDGTARAQQYIIGKPSTRLKNADSAPPNIRPDPVLPEEH